MYIYIYILTLIHCYGIYCSWKQVYTYMYLFTFILFSLVHSVVHIFFQSLKTIQKKSQRTASDV